MSKLRKSCHKPIVGIGDHQKYISRITKSLYYGKLPKNDDLSLPVTELAAEIFSEAQHGKSLSRLHCDDAAKISQNACVSPCSLVLAILYLERLKTLNPGYLDKTAPTDLFLVSLMVSCKFLYDDGEEDEVFTDEWAKSGGITVKQLIDLEKDFLKAIKWEIFVNELSFFKKLSDIETAIAQRQGRLRGFFTYTELENLLKTIQFYSIMQNFAAMTVILCASYAAALLALVGSVIIVGQVPGSCININASLRRIESGRSLPISAEQGNSTDFDILAHIDPEKTDFGVKTPPTDGLNAIKTSFFMASIGGLLIPQNETNCYDNVDINSESVSWDWWNSPTMTWLYNKSQFVKEIKLPVFNFNFGFLSHYLESLVSKNRQLEMQDHINKATKTRIQDQIENSWHMEWADTIISSCNPHMSYYLPNVKT